MDYHALHLEITEGPLAAETAPLYEAGDFGGVLAILADKRFTSQHPIKATVLHSYLIRNLKWRGIKAVAATPNHPAIDAAYSAAEIMADPNTPIDFTHPQTAALADGLVAAGLITAQNKADMIAYGTVAESRLTLTGLAGINAIDISEAKRMYAS